MTTAIYEYPKTSCNCMGENMIEQDCLDQTTSWPVNTNFSGCNFPNCNPGELTFRKDMEPRLRPGWSIINPQCLKDKQSRDFISIGGNISSTDSLSPNQTQSNTISPQSMAFYGYIDPISPLEKSSNKEAWISSDPRLFDAQHVQYLKLDRPPIESKMKLSDIAHDTKLDGYGQNYRTYSDINAGQIQYYVNNQDADPFYEPNFTQFASVDGKLYTDPMTSTRPQYYRNPVYGDKHIGGSTKAEYRGGLSFIQDTMDHREDLMSQQMGIYNEREWTQRWNPGKTTLEAGGSKLFNHH